MKTNKFRLKSSQKKKNVREREKRRFEEINK